MSLATRIESLVIRVAQEFNDVRATAGNLASLSTTDKSSLVAAINELKAAVLSATAIDDNQIATSTTYSSNKIVSLLDALKAVGIPTVEVHISDVSAREDFRQRSFVRATCIATVMGKGFDGYCEAMDILLKGAQAE